MTPSHPTQMDQQSGRGSEHTAGPWWVAGKATVRHGDGVKAGWIADVHWRNRAANARLITAAPDLLSALQGYMAAVTQLNAAMQDGVNVHGALSTLLGCEDNAHAAIAKATGARA